MGSLPGGTPRRACVFSLRQKEKNKFCWFGEGAWGHLPKSLFIRSHGSRAIITLFSNKSREWAKPTRGAGAKASADLFGWSVCVGRYRYRCAVYLVRQGARWRAITQKKGFYTCTPVREHCSRTVKKEQISKKKENSLNILRELAKNSHVFYCRFGVK